MASRQRRGRGDRTDSAALLQRQWAVLQMIPREPQYVDTPTLAERLAAECGHDVKPRTLQRELQGLSQLFAIKVDDSAKPYRWSWVRDARTVTLPGIDARGALLVLLVEQYLRAAVPPALEESLATLTDAARQAIAGQNNKLGAWLRSVRVIPRFMSLVPPKTKRDVVVVAASALLERKKLLLTYRGRTDKESKDLVINPLGLVIRDSIIYLVGNVDGYEDARHFALHRALNAELLGERRAQRSADFDLEAYVSEGRLGFRFSPDPIRITLRFAPSVAHVLFETPISKDQESVRAADGSLEVSAAVADTQQLRSWILGFGSLVEVISPESLRSWVRAETVAMTATYAASAQAASQVDAE